MGFPTRSECGPVHSIISLVLSLGIPPPPPPGGLPRMPPPPFVDPTPPVAPPMPNKRDAELEDMAGKKARSEPAEANLIPENIFLSSNPNPVTFGVQIPLMPDKGEWKLDGNTIRLTLPLTDQVSEFDKSFFSYRL